jgi:adenosylcobinamide-GDP ribazoletransferase
MTGPLRRFLLALQFFTRIPITGPLAQWVGYSPDMLRASAGHITGVGVLIGLCCAAVFAGLLAALPPVSASPWVAAILSTAAGAQLTGAFHEDGLSDLVDGLGGSLDREKALDIMKDSRIGSFGALALILVVLAKCGLLALLASVSAPLAVSVLFVGHVASRLPPLFLIASLPHVGDTPRSKSKPLADAVTPAVLCTGVLWCVGAMALALWVWPAAWWLAGWAGVAVVAWVMRQWLQRRLHGFTGDGLGATQQLAEIGFYLGIAMAVPLGVAPASGWGWP